MALHRITRGLTLPIAGSPELRIDEAPAPARVALLAADYVGLRPNFAVAVGDTVKRGQVLFTDKKNSEVRFTAPGAGTILAIHRGERRALQSIVIDLSAEKQRDTDARQAQVPFASFTGKDPAGLSRTQIKALLLESGLWTALRTRPFSKVPAPSTEPTALFITAMDTNPLAPPPELIVKGREALFEKGLLCVSKLTEGKVYLCKAPGAAIPGNPNTGLRIEEFAGPHPAGTVGVHIHTLDPVHRDNIAWHIGYQDVLAIGTLFTSGQLDVERVIALAGPSVKRPRLVRTRLGADLATLTQGELADGDHRVISGSVLSGRTAQGEVAGYLGRYHLQVSAIPEGRGRHFLGWLAPGTHTFSVTNAFLSKFLKASRFAFTTSLNGSQRAMVPIGVYEKVVPMDILPTFLLRALLMNDVERAEQLGCLELDEEDLALCTFVCPSKLDYGPILRRILDRIDKEG